MNQNSLFGITPKELSLKMEVSEATIRNWIKTGYLKKEGEYISFESIQNLQKIIGKEKLTKRANKLKKDSFDYEKISSLFLENLDKEHISQKYENSLSESYKNKEGIFYTPEYIVSDLVNIKKDAKFCDPCCGSGNFLIEAIKQGISVENIYGYDTDKVAVEIAKKRIFDLTGYKTPNIICTDFLKTDTPKFDYIFTNPPWGKKISKKEKLEIAYKYGIKEALDTSSLFFVKSIDILKEGGVLGFLLQEAFFNVATFKEARQEALKYNIIRLVDYKKPFKLITRAQAITLKKTSPQKYITCEWEDNIYKREQKSFFKNPKNIFNFYCNSEDSKVIDYIYSLNYTTLKDSKWALGIVTGNNKKFIINEKKENYLPIYKGKHITKNGIIETDEFIPNDLSLYQQVAPKEMYESKKLVYKFISSKLCFAYDDKGRYFLNSANILIPNLNISFEVLKDLLNSNFMNWIFKNIFNTHKVLRSDLEELPIFEQYLKNGFNEKDYLNALGIKQENGTYKIKKS